MGPAALPRAGLARELGDQRTRRARRELVQEALHRGDVGEAVQALGVAAHFVAKFDTFGRFPAADLVRTLNGQINRGHYLFALDASADPARVIGYFGWALYDQAVAIVSGIGYGLVYRARGTSGGSDVLARILGHYRGVPMTQSYLIVDTIVILADGNGRIVKEMTVGELLPEAFTPERLEEGRQGNK